MPPRFRRCLGTLPLHIWVLGVLECVCMEVGVCLPGLVSQSSKGGSVPSGTAPALCLLHEIPLDAALTPASDAAFPIPQGLEAHKYKNTWDCAYQIMKHEGPLA